MIAGLVFQVFTLLLFICLSIDFGLRVRRRSEKLGANALTQDPHLVAIRRSWPFKGFLIALGLATITVFWRCVFRVAELDEGWVGPVTFKQGLFIGFEGIMMVVTVAALAIFHPCLCLGAAFEKLSDLEKHDETRVADGVLVDAPGNQQALNRVDQPGADDAVGAEK